MKSTKTLKIAGAALIAVLYAGAPAALAGEGHDHGKMDGHGHDHGKMGDDGHGHGSESAADHAKHHPKPSHGGVVLELADHHGELVVKDGKLYEINENS